MPATGLVRLRRVHEIARSCSHLMRSAPTSATRRPVESDPLDRRRRDQHPGLDAEDVATAIRSDALHPGEGGEVCARASDRDPGRSSLAAPAARRVGSRTTHGRPPTRRPPSMVARTSTLSTANGPDTSSLPGRSFALTVHRGAARSFRPLRRHPPSHRARPRLRPVQHTGSHGAARDPRRGRADAVAQPPTAGSGIVVPLRSFAPCRPAVRPGMR